MKEMIETIDVMVKKLDTMIEDIKEKTLTDDIISGDFSNSEKLENIEKHFNELAKIIGLDEK